MSGGKRKGGEQSLTVAPDPEEWAEREPPPEFLEEVAGWFRHPQGEPWPSKEAVYDFADILTRFNKAYCDNIREFNCKFSMVINRQSKMLKALDTLEIEIPEWVKSFEMVPDSIKENKYFKDLDKKLSHDKVLFENALLNIIEIKKTLDIGQIFDGTIFQSVIVGRAKKGRRRDWEAFGLIILEFIYYSWEKAGRVAPLPIDQSSPLVRVLVHALQYQGWDVTEAGVSKWLEGRRKKPKKSRAISSERGKKSMGK